MTKGLDKKYIGAMRSSVSLCDGSEHQGAEVGLLTVGDIEVAQPKALCIGIIRRGKVLVRLYGREEQVASPRILACTGLSGKYLFDASGIVSAGDSHALDNLYSSLSERTKSRLSSLPFSTDAAFDIEENEIYERMSVRSPNKSGAIEWATRDTSLRSLLPRDREAFRERLSFEVRRHIDPETVRFVTAQVLRLNTPLPQGVNDDALGYLVNTFVIHAYKCAEIDDVDNVALSADVRAMAFIALSKMAPNGDGVRDDPDHLFVSVHTALWHLEITKGNSVTTIESLREIYERYRQGEEGKLPVNYSYNFCLSLLMYGVMLYRIGRIEEAKRSFWYTIECFRRAVATGTKNATWFREMGVSHAAAANAFDILDRLRRREAFDTDFLIEMSEAALRVRVPHFKAATARLINSLEPGI